MPRSSGLLALACLLAFAAPAAGDGPYEPNELADAPFGPLAGGPITAAFETPQDVDWFVFYAHNHRQIGVLLTLGGVCPVTTGSISVQLLDGDSSGLSKRLGDATVGWNHRSDAVVAAGQLAFTSLAGHRYLLKVTQSGCQNTPYTVDVAPAENLTPTLVDTTECSASKREYQRQVKRWYALRDRYRRARGIRRRALRSQVAIQRQTATVAASTAQATCTRPTLSAYPYG